MTKKPQRSWLGYIEKIVNQKFDQQPSNIDGIEKIMNLNSSFNSLFFHSVPIIYLLDYTTGQYITMSKSSKVILGFDPQEWERNGVSFTVDLYNEDDLKLFNNKIFPDRLDILSTIPPDEQKNYIFSNNYRLRNANNEYVNLLQRNCFIKSDENGSPLISLGMVLNVGQYQKENPVIQVVEKVDIENNSCNTVFKKTYYQHEKTSVFSRRELEVLLWIAEGLTSKEIADKMYLSEATVINHRKNMLFKSGAKNVAELISFALKNQII